MRPGLLLAALAIDAALGDPAWLWRRLPHPVVWFGRLVGVLDHSLNQGRHRRARGVLAVALLLAATVPPAYALQQIGGGPVSALCAAILLAQRSLYQHVAAVETALRTSLEEGRRAVAQIVGRDPAVLDQAGVCRAAIESCAENFSDGVVAPAFWFALLGLPGIVAYKAINTADSMIGHRTPRHEAFGWAAARLDDGVNWVPARLSGLLIAAAALSWHALRVMARDAGRHRSPNAGWPESAMAAALGVTLSGPRRYGAVLADEPVLHPEGRAATPDDIGRCLRLFVRTCVLHAALYAAWLSLG